MRYIYIDEWNGHANVNNVYDSQSLAALPPELTVSTILTEKTTYYIYVTYR